MIVFVCFAFPMYFPNNPKKPSRRAVGNRPEGSPLFVVFVDRKHVHVHDLELKRYRNPKPTKSFRPPVLHGSGPPWVLEARVVPPATLKKPRRRVLGK